MINLGRVCDSMCRMKSGTPIKINRHSSPNSAGSEVTRDIVKSAIWFM